MSDKNISWLYKELPELIEENIISEETAQEIRNYYGPIKEKDKDQNLLLIFSILGAVLIGSGIILLLAHNWSQLTRLSRTGIIFSGLIGAQTFLAWVLINRSYSVSWREGSATFLTFIVGAAIALIGQTYHLPSDLSNFLLTWMLLIVPLVYIVDTTIPALIYLAGISWWGLLVQGQFRLLFWLLAALVVPYYIKQIKQDKTSRKVTVLSWGLSISILFGLGSTLEVSSYSAILWRLIYLSYFSILFLLGQKISLKTRVLEGLGLLGSWFVIYELGALKNSNLWELDILNSGNLFYYIIIVLFLAINIYLLRENYLKGDRNNLILGTAPFVLLLTLFIKIYTLNLVIYNAYLLLIALGVLVYGLDKKKIKLANLGILMIAVQIIGRFFFLDISFIWRRIVFVVVGIGFLVSNIIMSRRLKGEENNE
ncbi:DUF2157 domain-containing protein [Halanaerobacter jeridensis]|uniref:Membrane protein n=1 Tax=Halanaerobacter jeridensis TaxID=706427 RepID=A0A938XSR0_9FIRM|nr:DUF2157 domain-containing protein [Halanaerobacter jeridensis]MBM7556159.1 putative membrane protein [Halanaerobacter jeridensis]